MVRFRHAERSRPSGPAEGPGLAAAVRQLPFRRTVPALVLALLAATAGCRGATPDPAAAAAAPASPAARPPATLPAPPASPPSPGLTRAGSALQQLPATPVRRVAGAILSTHLSLTVDWEGQQRTIAAFQTIHVKQNAGVYAGELLRFEGVELLAREREFLGPYPDRDLREVLRDAVVRLEASSDTAMRTEVAAVDVRPVATPPRACNSTPAFEARLALRLAVGDQVGQADVTAVLCAGVPTGIARSVLQTDGTVPFRNLGRVLRFVSEIQSLLEPTP